MSNIKTELGTWASVLPIEAIQAGERALAQVDSIIKAGTKVYPPRESIFAALQHTPPERVKAVIVGQDPYHGKDQANGLAFSVAPECKIPPSLRNIFKELVADIDCPVPPSGDLTTWADRGVLLLNSVLTVESGRPNSHAQLGWRDFTRGIYQACAALPQPVVFLTWGAQARADMAGLLLAQRDKKRHIWASHPSPLGCYRATESCPAFIGSRPFSGTNGLLKEMGSEPINWRLD